MKLIDADELFKSFESEENPEDSLWTLYGIKRKIEDAPRQEPCEDATLRDIFCMGCEYKEQEPKTGHWIPVSEKLPEEETDVLICNENGDIGLSRGSYSTEIENDFIWYTSGWRFGKVIAWMSLPEPYNAESEEI